jgi:hypothetical protein
MHAPGLADPRATPGGRRAPRWQSLGPYFDSDDAPHLAAVRAALDNIEVYGPLRLEEAEALASTIAPEPL